jgi:hypothetical protein
LSVGQDGIVVLGSVNPFGDGPHDVYNFFYVLWPGHRNAAAARALLGELPSTDAAPVARPADRGSNLDAALLVLLIAGAAVGIQVLGSHRRR